jgi:hypothetical protein
MTGDERSERENAVAPQQLDAAPVVLDRRRLVHVLQHVVRGRLDAKKDAPAAALGRQRDRLLVDVAAAEVREPFEAELALDHPPAQLLEPWQRHVEGVVDEDHIAHAADGAHRFQLALDRVDTGQRQTPRPGWIRAKGARERAAARRPRLQRYTKRVIGQPPPIDPVLVENIVLRYRQRASESLALAIDDVRHRLERQAVPDRGDDPAQCRLALAVDDIDVSAKLLEHEGQLFGCAAADVIADQRSADDDRRAGTPLADEPDDVDDRQVEHIEGRGDSDRAGAAVEQHRQPILLELEQVDVLGREVPPQRVGQVCRRKVRDVA